MGLLKLLLLRKYFGYFDVNRTVSPIFLATSKRTKVFQNFDLTPIMPCVVDEKRAVSTKLATKKVLPTKYNFAQMGYGQLRSR